jgi:ABC-type Fe3+-hydroxamate transport system substrate-binding protein
MKHSVLKLLLLGLLLSACAPAAAVTTPTANEATLTVAAAASEQAALKPTEAAPVSPYSLEALAKRTYGQGELRVEYAWQDKAEFTRYYITL